ERSAEASRLRFSNNYIGSVDPNALKIPTRRAEYSLADSALSPFQPEPTQFESTLWARWGVHQGRHECRRRTLKRAPQRLAAGDQAGAAVAGDVVVHPLGQHQQAVLEFHQIHQVHEDPREPGD